MKSKRPFHTTVPASDAASSPSGAPPASAEQAKQHMLDEITRNSTAIVDALIRKAVTGHYQAARFLLDEMSKMSVEQQGDGCRSIAEILLPVAEHLFAKRKTEQTADAEPRSDSSSEHAVSDDVDPDDPSDRFKIN